MKIIISLDGGGIRGIIPAAILEHLEKKVQEYLKDPRVKLANLVDFIAGTSTGSIVGSLMALPDDKGSNPRYNMTDIKNLYIKIGPGVFKKNIWHSISTLWGIIGPIYPKTNIEDPLLEIFNHYKMQDLIKPCLFTGYDIDKRIVNIYTNKDINEKYGSYYVKDIVRGSTAIPAYFSPAYFRDGTDINTIVDGGTFANNPTMVAYTEVSKTSFSKDKNAKYKKPKDVFIISLGTGKSNKEKYPYKKSKSFGILKWVFPILDILLTGVNDVVDHEMSVLFNGANLPDNYTRINPPLIYSTKPSTDASNENINNLLKDAEKYIKENSDYLNDIAIKICKIKKLIKVED